MPRSPRGPFVIVNTKTNIVDIDRGWPCPDHHGTEAEVRSIVRLSVTALVRGLSKLFPQPTTIRWAATELRELANALEDISIRRDKAS